MAGLLTVRMAGTSQTARECPRSPTPSASRLFVENQAAVNRLRRPQRPEAADVIGLGTRVLDSLIKSDSQRVQRDDTDALNVQQLELWPESQ